jgi:hypothetical protein
MAKLTIDRGTTSNILRVFLQDSTSTTGAGKTGLTNSSTGLIISTIANNEATATTYTSAASNVETITTLGTFAAPTASKCRFKEVDATNFPGVYEIQIADARFAVTSAKALLVSVQASGVAPVVLEVQQDQSDQVLSRNASNVEDALATASNFHNLGTIILAMLENSISGTTLTIKKTGGTTFTTKTLTTTAASTANVITGVD